MKKQEQIAINEKVVAEINAVGEYIENCNLEWKKFRSCNAEVATTPRYYILRSYRTIIAVIDRRTDTLFDFLRWAYGFTSTSAQHISKFDHDYCQAYYGCKHRYTYRDV